LRERVARDLSYSKNQLPALELDVATHTKKFDTLNKTLLAFEGRRRDIHDDFDIEMAKTMKMLEEKREQDLLGGK
jgi:hypothetical protein